jgi:hypothetical protein
MTNNIPENDDAPWLNLTPQEVEELRYNKQNLTEYGREKIRALMLKSQMTEDIQQPNGDFLKNYPDVTRVEVIGNDGREFVHYGCSNVKVSLQDDGRTIKVFLYTTTVEQLKYFYTPCFNGCLNQICCFNKRKMTELLVDGHNHCLRKMKEMLR